jgi:hypothetical protein
MYTEQAYVDGFLKRASEHGIASDGAIMLLKKAMRGQAIYALMNNMSRANAAQKLTSKFAPPGRILKIPERGSMNADVLAGLGRQVKKSIKTPTQNPQELNKRYLMQNTGRRIMHPSPNPFDGESTKAMNAGMDLLGDASPWKRVNPQFADSPRIIWPHAR